MEKIQIGIVGYGNLGRGVECSLLQNPDMKLGGIFTRRPPWEVASCSGTELVFPIEELDDWAGGLDVLILCGGSAHDLPEQSPYYAQKFHLVDSFDNHGEIPQHFQKVNQAALKGGKVALISAGWDPGLFSLNRVLGEAILPVGTSYTFWGKGVSQGHSDALRRVTGVADGVQYTIPKEEALNKVRQGKKPSLSPREKHERHCYVVLKPEANKEEVMESIKTMPHYFAESDTSVVFVSQQELNEQHKSMPHGGFVLRSGSTGVKNEHKQLMDYSLKLESNPQFTASVLVAYARGVYRMGKEGQQGCKTVLDMPPAYLSPLSGENLRKEFL